LGQQSRNPFTRVHVAYVALVGAAALAVLAWAVVSDPRTLLQPIWRHPGAFATFAVLAFLSRMMAFRVLGAVVFSLDTGVYVASLVTLGTGPATVVVFGAMLLRGLVEHLRRELGRQEHWPPLVTVAKLFFGPSVTAVLTLAIGSFLGPDKHFANYLRSTSPSELPIWGSVAVFLATTLALIAPQFAIVTLSYRLNGYRWQAIFRELIAPGFLGELAFTPLGFALAIAYRDQDLRTLGALAISYITFNYIFRRMWTKSEAEAERGRELALVEEVGRTVASTMDVEEMGRRIGMAVMDAFGDVTGVVLTAFSSNGEKPLHYVRARDRAMKPALLQATTRVLVQQWDCPCEDAPTDDPPPVELGKVIVYPLITPDGQKRGFLTVVLSQGARATRRHSRILASISRQAAVAVYNWRLYSLATVDGLTGLYVRRYLEARLKEEFERASRANTSFCLLLIDVDNLKIVNDLHGHGAGDQLLCAVAAAMRDSIRGMDVAARWGGDEFAVMLPDMGIEAGLVVGRRLAESVRARSFVVGSTLIIPSVSIGVAWSGQASDPSSLFVLADQALYAVKKSGSKGTVIAAGGG